MKNFDINKLTPEERAELLKTLEADKQEQENNLFEERKSYKSLVEETVKKSFNHLKLASQVLEEAKNEIFENFKNIMELKKELYGFKESQQSHTFTTEDGTSIKIGYRMIDSFDDTVHAGIEKIKTWIFAQAEGDRKTQIEAILNLLLKKDKKGNLKASRVLELRKLADEISDPEFRDGVKIIEDSWKQSRSSTFIEAYYKDENGKDIVLPLSITSVDLRGE